MREKVTYWEIKYMKLQENIIFWFYGQHLTLTELGCQQTGSHVEQMEPWFNVGQVALLPIVLKLFHFTCVSDASNLQLLCSSVSVQTHRDCTDGVDLSTHC